MNACYLVTYCTSYFFLVDCVKYDRMQQKECNLRNIVCLAILPSWQFPFYQVHCAKMLKSSIHFTTLPDHQLHIAKSPTPHQQCDIAKSLNDFILWIVWMLFKLPKITSCLIHKIPKDYRLPKLLPKNENQQFSSCLKICSNFYYVWFDFSWSLRVTLSS